jgi:hypothetical protein
MFKTLYACLGLLTVCGAQADTLPTPQPLAPSARTKDDGSKIGAPRRLPSPAVSVTRVRRQPDGSLSIDCVQRPNPKLHLPGSPATPHDGGVQP